MRPTFRTGPLTACACILAAVDRPALIAAIVRHATSLPVHGEPVTTYHEHGAMRFRIETDAERLGTSIRLG